MAGLHREISKSNEGDKQGKAENPCLFLIHVSVSPEAAAAIGDYIAMRGEIDVYRGFCPEPSMEIAEEDGDRLDRHLQDGLAQASHVLCLISPLTMEPWWIKRVRDLAGAAGVELALLTLKGVTLTAGTASGSFEVLRGIKSLNEYLCRVSPRADRIIFNNPDYGGLMAHTAPNHPLDAFLEWEK